MPIRLTIRGLMVAVALIGLCLAAFRVHFSLGSFTFGTLSIAWVRMSAEINRRRATESPTELGVVVGIYLTCLLKVAAVLLTCLIPAFLLAPVFFTPRHCHDHPYNSPYVVEGYLAVSAACAWLVFRVIHLLASPRPARPFKRDPDDPRGFG